MNEYERAAVHILEVIMKRKRYGFEVRDMIAKHIEKTHKSVDRANILKEAKLLMKK